MPMKRFNHVRQVVPVISGHIVSKVFDEVRDVFTYLVAWTDAATGEYHEKWFEESELELTGEPDFVPPPEPEEGAPEGNVVEAGIDEAAAPATGAEATVSKKK